MYVLCFFFRACFSTKSSLKIISILDIIKPSSIESFKEVYRTQFFPIFFFQHRAYGDQQLSKS